MSDFDSRVLALFRSLRQQGLALGLDDLLDAERALRALAMDEAAAGRALGSLWGHDVATRGQIVAAWRSAATAPEPSAESDDPPVPAPPRPDALPKASSEPEMPSAAEPLPPHPGIQAAPVRPAADLDYEPPEVSLDAYTPLTRRQMDYAFRAIRRPAPTGPRDLLDVDATIDEAARLGFFLRPRLRRRSVDEFRLLLLVDRNGSMAPFHRLSESLVDAAVEATGAPDEERLRVFYFHNDPGDWLYRTPRLAAPVALPDALAGVDADWSALIVSDAGAARGTPNARSRSLGPLRLLRLLGERTASFAWLNPVPAARWADTAAETIARRVPMHPMSHEGMGMATDALRGHTALRGTR